MILPMGDQSMLADKTLQDGIERVIGEGDFGIVEDRKVQEDQSQILRFKGVDFVSDGGIGHKNVMG